MSRSFVSSMHGGVGEHDEQHVGDDEESAFGSRARWRRKSNDQQAEFETLSHGSFQ